MWFRYSKLLTQHIRDFLQVWLGPYPNFWAGPGDEASGEQPLVARARVSVCPSLATPRATNTIVHRAQHLLQWSSCLVPRPSPAPVFALRDGLTWFSDRELSWNRSTLLLLRGLSQGIPGMAKQSNIIYIVKSRNSERISYLAGETLLEATDAWSSVVIWVSVSVMKTQNLAWWPY